MIHHLAITPKDFAKSHQFYTEVMGFALVKIVKRQAMGGEKAGWTKHVFYDTGAGSYFVMWDLHLSDFTRTRTGIPRSHSASDCRGGSTTSRSRSRISRSSRPRSSTGWPAATRSAKLSTNSSRRSTRRTPTATWSSSRPTPRPLTDEDRDEAQRLLLDDTPAVDPDYPGVIYLPDGRVIEAASSA